MKAIIFAGGLGARLSEGSESRPKPMEEIGGRPILWHILKMYSHHGINDFVICLGFQGYMIKEFFANYYLHTAAVTFDLAANAMEVHESAAEPWKITLVNTGETTGTAGRLKLAAGHLHHDDPFCLSYGDTVSDLDISASVEMHRSSGKLATLTAVQSEPRFGNLNLAGEDVSAPNASASDAGGWVNGGFYVLSPRVLDYIGNDPQQRWEQEPLHALAEAKQLNAYRHRGFWQPMDAVRDRKLLESLWAAGRAPWKTW